MKTCVRCGKEKPLEDFKRDKRRTDGHGSYCLVCHGVQSREAREANPEASRASARQRMQRWRLTNPERARESAQRSAARRKETDYTREWYQRNIEKERARSRESMRLSRLANPEAERERKRRYREGNTDRVREREREKTQRRRALRGPFSEEAAAAMTQLLQDPCAYCGSTENITIDHIVPLSRGGKHEPANLAPACWTCNCSKGARLPSEWSGPLQRTA